MTTLAELVDGVYSDLADESKAVFSTLQVEDFVRGGIAELNRAAPTDTFDDLVLVSDPDTSLVTQFSYDTPIVLPYRVDVVQLADGSRWELSDPGQADGYVGSGGYTFRKTPTGGTIDFPPWWLSTFNALLYGIRLYGYANRALPYQVDPDPSPEVGLSPEEEYSVRSYAKAAGYDLLSHDRSLFAQWQGGQSNTDVSPTQMMQMAMNAMRVWDRQRGLIRTVRRFW